MNYWKPSKGYKKGEKVRENIIKFINFHLLWHYSYFFLTFSK